MTAVRTAEAPRVVFVDRDPPSGFMAVDRRCLETIGPVEHLVYPGALRPGFAWASLRAAARSDVVYAFFASEHALFPALAAKALRRRFVLVPAGYDYANVPERGYGLAARGRGWLPRLLGRLCDVALPISQQTEDEFLALVPTARERSEVAYLGLDPTQWTSPGVERDHDTVVTVGYVDEEAWSRKGIDRFVEAARRDPDRRYVLAGRLAPAVEQRLATLAPPNLACPGRLEHDELRALLWSAGVYAQLSWHETFGVSMAEAMLCGCVPVIRDSQALHEVAGPWAVEVEGDDDVDAIRRAAELARTVDRVAMHDDLADRFSLRRREDHLRRAVLEAVA
jgi:glycosyltransferase involved in cell wall biosynthesis